MLFVGAASYAQLGPVVGANSSLVGQTGTSQMHKLSNWNAQSSKIKQTINNNDVCVSRCKSRANYRIW
jgi:hypothetical protein